MKVKYKSKVSVLIAFIFIGTPLLCVLGAIGEGKLDWMGDCYIDYSPPCKYVFFKPIMRLIQTQATLRIKGGIMVHETLAIKDIRKIEETKQSIKCTCPIDRPFGNSL